MIAYDDQLQLLEIKQTEGKIPQLDWSLDGSKKFEGFPFLSLEAKAGPDYFYVLNPKLIYRPFSDEEPIDPSIDIYNWEMVASLKLDKLLSNLSIDFDNKKIYGVTFGSGDQVLGEVSIPASLHQFF